MRFWKRSAERDAALDRFAESVPGELSALPVPAAADRLLARVLASRRAGQRRDLPLADDPWPRRTRFILGAIAAALTVVLAVALTMGDRGVGSERAGWFIDDHAYAEARGPEPIYPGVRVTRADRMRPLRLTYRSTVRTAAAPKSWDIALSATRDVVNGVPAWRVVSSGRGPGPETQHDSVWVSAATFAPLRRTIVEAPYRRYERIEVRQTFEGLRVRGEMQAFQHGTATARRRVERTLPTAFAPFVDDAFAPLFHVGVAMDRNWTGSVGLLGWAVRDDDVFASMTMRVDGEERVQVPAGAFDCWRIAIDFANGRHHWYWVRKADGLGIRAVDSTQAGTRGVRETVLSAEQAP